MKRPLSVPFICWANIAVNYLIALGMTLIMLAVGTSSVDLGDFYLLLVLPYLNLILVVYLNKRMLLGQRWARAVFLGWYAVLCVLAYFLFTDLQIVAVTVIFFIVNVTCLYNSTANHFFIAKKAIGS